MLITPRIAGHLTCPGNDKGTFIIQRPGQIISTRPAGNFVKRRERSLVGIRLTARILVTARSFVAAYSLLEGDKRPLVGLCSSALSFIDDRSFVVGRSFIAGQNFVADRCFVDDRNFFAGRSFVASQSFVAGWSSVTVRNFVEGSKGSLVGFYFTACCRCVR